jgi:hypothetical protein
MSEQSVEEQEDQESIAGEAASPEVITEAPVPPISPAVLEQITEYFSPCGRCGYFWVGYRVLAGEALATAVQQPDDTWLLLRWQNGMRNLLHHSYGCRTDILHDYFAGCCKECRRDFVFSQEEDDAESVPEFRIKLLPG